MTATATAPKPTLAERSAMLQKIINDLRAARTEMVLADRSGYCYAFREVPGFAMHVDGNGLVGLGSRNPQIRRDRLPAGRQFQNKAGHVAVYMPLAEVMAAALKSNDDAIAGFFEMATNAGLTVE